MKVHRFVTIMHYTQSGDLVQRIWTLNRVNEFKILELLGQPHTETIQPASALEELRRIGAETGATIVHVPSEPS
jgi:hypothetical protein